MLTWNSIVLSVGWGGQELLVRSNEESRAKYTPLDLKGRTKDHLGEEAARFRSPVFLRGTGVNPCDWLATMSLVLGLFWFSSACVLSVQQFPFYLKTSWPGLFVKDNMDE